MPLADGAQPLAERFHQVLEGTLRPTDREPVAWHDMPEKYRRRILHSFDAMIRLGYIRPGARLDFEPPEEE